MNASRIDHTLDCLRQTLPAGSQIIVFGSQARGDARDDSDIDLLVVEPDVPDRFGEMARLSAVLGRQRIPADVVVMSAQQFAEQKTVINTLAWRAAREGQLHELAR
ncbi:MAG: nucleotidyltransferase domain-containing protein [Rubrivivax sp.]|nr:nucleotidyltransferase domain-containing protein [Rubrivivax sp.]